MNTYSVKRGVFGKYLYMHYQLDGFVHGIKTVVDQTDDTHYLPGMSIYLKYMII